MKFADYRIDEQLKQNIADQGFKRPTDIQFKSIPPVLKREDVLAIAQTGTGKTAAYVIPVLHNLLKKKIKTANGIVRCVVMVPTHELASQTAKVFEQFSIGLGINSLFIHGGTDQQPQINKLKKGVEVLIATPGRLFDLRSQGHIQLDKLEILILDEADLMLDMGFINDIRDLLKFIPKKRQTLFFSATISHKIKKLAYSIVQNPIRIQISPKNPVSKNVFHYYAKIEMDHKRFFLERIVKENPESKILCFVRTKVRAERVKAAMQRVDIDSLTMHSDKENKERTTNLSTFASGAIKLLIATDVSARGIDIPDVDIVINYDLPELTENYVHRVGRTGRGTKKGTAISFCSTEENSIREEIEHFLGQPLIEQKLDKDLYYETLDNSTDSSKDWRSLMGE